VGTRTIERVIEAVQEDAGRRSAAELLSSTELRERVAGAGRTSMARLSHLMRRLGDTEDVQRMILQVLEGHYAAYADRSFTNAATRVEDLEQLGEYAGRYDGLEQFLSDLALVAGLAAESAGPGELPDEKLTLSTVHQAKGLEWRVVFILWLTEGHFPQAMALRAEEDQEEERRLFHVATTRAEEQLYLCQPRFEEPRDGPRRMLRLSRFLAELAGPRAPFERWTIEEVAE
jgi:DNA helicase-2/ATP-dependent DNA helicase PcrA